MPGGYPIDYRGLEYKSSEHLFQALRYLVPAKRAEKEGNQERAALLRSIAEEIRRQNSGFGAKCIVKKKEYRHLLSDNQEVWKKMGIPLMRFCLIQKLRQNPELQKYLLATGSRPIIEDCTNRQRGSAFFWGAVKRGNEWEGANVLGKLWMELRTALRETGCLPPATDPLAEEEN
jgi:predicted NAD-dependent protein-ADP-ribosyltransferase YbiA (DUF1768 family)